MSAANIANASPICLNRCIVIQCKFSYFRCSTAKPLTSSIFWQLHAKYFNIQAYTTNRDAIKAATISARSICSWKLKDEIALAY